MCVFGAKRDDSFFPQVFTIVAESDIGIVVVADHPGVVLKFVVELSGAPAGVSDKEFYFLLRDVTVPYQDLQALKITTPINTIAETNATVQNRKSTRLNSSHVKISYAVFCLKKKKKKNRI